MRILVVWASGSKGNRVLFDHEGNKLSRGYHLRGDASGGPYKTKREAKETARSIIAEAFDPRRLRLPNRERRSH